MKQKIIKSLACVKSLSRIYTGGQAYWCGGQIVSLVSGALHVVEAGEVRHVVEEEEDPALCFTVAPDEEGQTVRPEVGRWCAIGHCFAAAASAHDN